MTGSWCDKTRKDRAQLAMGIRDEVGEMNISKNRKRYEI